MRIPGYIIYGGMQLNMTVFDTVSSLLPKGLVHANEPMSRHTSFKIGGPAEVYVTPENTCQLTEIWQACLHAGYPITVLGGGCNVLVADEGIKGVVIATSRMCHIETNAPYITAGSGTRLARLAETACKAGLSGLEFAHGIPGTVGGAVFMNAGAYGYNIQDVCESVEVLKLDGTIESYPRQELGFSYRTSRFQGENEIITGATFKLTPGNPEVIRAKINELNSRRREKQPLCYPSAGSTFKRPAQEGFYASKMIDECGLKGLSVGDAQVSEKHAGFIVNKGNATAADVLALMESVQEKVHKAYGIWLEPEVQIIN